jgi:hypothetical protein
LNITPNGSRRLRNGAEKATKGGKRLNVLGGDLTPE